MSETPKPVWVQRLIEKGWTRVELRDGDVDWTGGKPGGNGGALGHLFPSPLRPERVDLAAKFMLDDPLCTPEQAVQKADALIEELLR